MIFIIQNSWEFVLSMLKANYWKSAMMPFVIVESLNLLINKLFRLTSALTTSKGLDEINTK